MNFRLFQKLIISTVLLFLALPTAAQKKCFTQEARSLAERNAKVWQKPDAGYDPVLGYDPSVGPHKGFPIVNESGLAAPITCFANPKPEKGSGTTPKFYCSVKDVTDEDGELVRYKIKPQFKGQTRDKRNGEIYGEFLSSRFSKALGFFADDEWVADVTCPDCEKSLTAKFQGAKYVALQPAAGIELPLGKGIDANCDGKDSGALDASLSKLLNGGASRAEIDAFKLWLAFIDHGDTKADNQEYACLKWTKAANGNLTCETGQTVYYVSDMGSTFGYSKESEEKARLKNWAGKDPIEVHDGRCTANAKSVGDTHISEEGRSLLAEQLSRLLEAQTNNNLITKVFEASRNGERDVTPQAWTAEFVRKAKTIINAKCSK